MFALPNACVFFAYMTARILFTLECLCLSNYLNFLVPCVLVVLMVNPDALIVLRDMRVTLVEGKGTADVQVTALGCT